MAVITELVASAEAELTKAMLNCAIFEQDATFLDDQETAELFAEVQTTLVDAKRSINLLAIKAGMAHSKLNQAQDLKGAPGLDGLLNRAREHHQADPAVLRQFERSVGWSVQRIRSRIRTRSGIRFEERDWALVRTDRNDPTGIITAYSNRMHRSYAIRFTDVDWQGVESSE